MLARVVQAVRSAFAAALPQPVPLALVCRTCGEAFVFPSHEQQRFGERGWCQPKHCRRCREWRRQPRETRGPAPNAEAPEDVVCKRCGVPFTLDADTRAWFLSRRLALPRTCRPCRKQRRDEGNARARAIYVPDV